jgi:hypothetical protein
MPRTSCLATKYYGRFINYLVMSLFYCVIAVADLLFTVKSSEGTDEPGLTTQGSLVHNFKIVMIVLHYASYANTATIKDTNCSNVSMIGKGGTASATTMYPNFWASADLIDTDATISLIRFVVYNSSYSY